MGKRFGQWWNTLTIRKKIMTFMSVVFIVCSLSLIFDIWILKFSLVDFNHILVENSKSIQLVQALENESALFKDYIQSREEVTLEMLNEAIVVTQDSVEDLTYDYVAIGEKRYSQTWSIRNVYEMYQGRLVEFLKNGSNNETYIADLYELYEIQEYLIRYANNLMNDTMQDGNDEYWEMVPNLLMVPWLLFLFIAALFFVMIKLSGLMNKTIISPVLKLGTASKQIAENNFYVDDVEVENEDELGELVKAFNKMKYATGQYITALEEKRKTLDLLHEEEMEKLAMETQIEGMKLELLKNQVNPHFLFNTLNVIGGMASLEDAEVTEKLIKALSSLFRYNLRTATFEVPLARELKVVEDYMYLQQMRFGDRISYDIVCSADQERNIVPSFLFQPLIENCILHGLAKKEEGGKIRIRVRREEEKLLIYIGDTGIGMTEEELTALREKLKKQKNPEEGHVGIGVGNIYRRVYFMYPEKGSMEIYSKYQIGTIIKIVIPQK